MNKEIKGFKGYYVNENGEVFNESSIPVKLRKQCSGYVLVSLRTDTGRYKQMLVHRLVAIAFLNLDVNERHVDRGVVDHINGIKDDNRLENLEVVTTRENNIRHHSRGK